MITDSKRVCPAHEEPAVGKSNAATSLDDKRQEYSFDNFPLVTEQHLNYCSQIFGVPVDELTKVVKVADSSGQLGEKLVARIKVPYRLLFLLGDGEGLRNALNQKWATMGIVSALILTITIPLALEPPERVAEPLASKPSKC
jgi:hypothetical protein